MHFFRRERNVHLYVQVYVYVYVVWAIDIQMVAGQKLLAFYNRISHQLFGTMSQLDQLNSVGIKTKA